MPTPPVPLLSTTTDSNRSPIFSRVASSSGATVSGIFTLQNVVTKVLSSEHEVAAAKNSLLVKLSNQLSNPLNLADQMAAEVRVIFNYFLFKSVFRLLSVATRPHSPPRCTRSRRSPLPILRKFSSIGFTTKKSPWFTTVPPRALQKASKPVTETGICSSGKKMFNVQL